jgi:hypothetical protein
MTGHRENEARSRDDGKWTLQDPRSVQEGLLQLPIRIEKDLARRQREEDPSVQVGHLVPHQGVREILEDPLALQAVRSVHLPEEAWVLLVSSAAVVVAVRLEAVASLGAAVVGVAEVAVERLGRLG